MSRYLLALALAGCATAPPRPAPDSPRMRCVQVVAEACRGKYESPRAECLTTLLPVCNE